MNKVITLLILLVIIGSIPLFAQSITGDWISGNGTQLHFSENENYRIECVIDAEAAEFYRIAINAMWTLHNTNQPKNAEDNAKRVEAYQALKDENSKIHEGVLTAVPFEISHEHKLLIIHEKVYHFQYVSDLDILRVSGEVYRRSN